MRELQTPMHTDVAVVGAGSAGCAVARRLVDAGLNVVVLEAGGADDNPAIHDPRRMFEMLGSPEDWAYVTVPQPGCQDRTIPCPRGRVLGGTSCLNAMIYARGHPSDYDTWAYLGNAGWSYADVLPIFRRSEDFDRGASKYHGAGGPLHVLSDFDPHPLLADVVAAAQEAGLALNPDYNGADMEGVSFEQLNIIDGERHNAARAFLHPVRDAPNLTILTRSQATRLLIEEGACVGVELLRNGQLVSIRIEHELFLCAGAIDSPKLLMLSGIGNASELERLGIPSQLDLPGVGLHLQDHVYSPIVYSAARPIPPAVPGIQQFHAHAFWRSRPGLIGPDIQTLLGHLPVYPEGIEGPPDGYTLASMLVRPVSTGAVTLASSDPLAAPVIDPRYLSCDADADAIAAGIELCREIARAPALDEWRGREIAPGEDVRSRSDLLRYVRRTCGTIYHPVGTCRMGSDRLSVVDAELRVHGIDRLRIADASIMPLITSANTHAPSVMIGERAADLVMAAAGSRFEAQEVGV